MRYSSTSSAAISVCSNSLLPEPADRIGMALANLSILKTGKARAIRFSTLDAICEALSCQPGDILRFEPE